jgi:hypothetical protein
MELQKPLTIRKGKDLMTSNKKTKPNEKSYNSEAKKRRKKNNLLKQLLQEKKSFRRRLFSHCVSRKSLTTMKDLTVRIPSEKK